jgi:ABC-type transporter Mla subunit MlaD
MRKAKVGTTEVKMPSRRQFINKAGLVTSGAILGSLTLLNACSLMDSLTKSQSLNPTIPTKISRIENLSEVTSVLRTEKEQISSFSNDLKQFQLDMNELDAILAQIGRMQDTMNGISVELSLKLQKAIDRRSQAIQTMSNIMEMQKDTQKELIANIRG